MSIIGVAKSNGQKFNLKKFLGICKTWVYTFPVCGIIGYVLAVWMRVIFER